MRKLLKNPTIKFLVVGALLYGAWLLVYYLLIKQFTNWDYLLNYNIVDLSQRIFSIFGTITFMDIESDHVVIVLEGSGRVGVWVGDECNGFKLFSIFSIFIVAFPGNWKTKLWFIPMGIFFIHLANIIRVMSLLLIDNAYPTSLDFNHLYTFTIFVYSIIFLLWMWWAKKFGNVKKN